MLFYGYINIFISVSNARIQTEAPLMKKANIKCLKLLALSIRLHFSYETTCIIARTK